MSALLLRLSLDSGFFGFGYSEVVFLFTEFPLCQQSGFFFFLHLRYFVAHKHTLGCLEVKYLFFKKK
jgi:hypothetical protein